ncbi:MAG TPA: carbohydrate ABC transporter permease [Anaerolineae bacterium]|nr:carbohydrate ABC transporter permease [Anaerolineae bacterium]HMR62525.1 carbohydrate ABC transporter permease [Anaerolineae bacterium]
MNKQTKARLGQISFVVVLAILIFYLLFPFYWAIVSSLKTSSQLFSVPVQYFPTPPTFQNYQVVFSSDVFILSLWNSVIVSVTVTAISLVVGSFAAYAIGRLPFRGRGIMLYVILAMTMFPLISVVGSLFTFVRNPCVIFGGDCSNLSMFNTRLSLIITYLIFTLPFTTYVLTNFFKSLPRDLEYAALVDGATPFQTFYLVLLPLTMPAMATTGMLAFINAWNEFLFAVSFTLDVNGGRTVQPVIAFFAGASTQEIPWGNIMAAAVVVTIPLIVLVLIFQRQIVDGLTAGAVKG